MPASDTWKPKDAFAITFTQGFGGVACDLVVLNSEPHSYLMPLQREIEALRNLVAQQTQNSFPRNDAAGFYLLRDAEVSASEKAALSNLARVVFTADGRGLESQVASLLEAGAAPKESEAVRRVAVSATPRVHRIEGVKIPPLGDFDAESG